MENQDYNAYDTFILSWSARFPYDRLWRKKYGIPFGSPQHLSTRHIDMAFDLREDILFKKFEDAEDEKELQMEADNDDRILNMLPKLPDNLQFGIQEGKVIKPSAKEIDEDFRNLDITKF